MALGFLPAVSIVGPRHTLGENGENIFDRFDGDLGYEN